MYYEHIKFLMNLLERYPDNRILVFPQTIYYCDKEKCEKDLKILATHKDIYICARDGRSYEVIEPFLKQRALLVPDMAFCIPQDEIKNIASKVEKSDKELFLLRRDGELSSGNKNDIYSHNRVELDWPTFYHKIFDGTFVFKSIAKLAHWNMPFMKSLLNLYCIKYFHKNLLDIGITFLSPYSTIYTTRLHGCILGILLGKNIRLIDNSYGKNSTFYNTWLKDFDNVDLLT
ncbi:MAG: polysaccharide pyruvyl transferase family protein [Prevotella sp.]|nr:polysaccharide pyruvyl transferase family protein [Prevotella sp.]